MLLFKLSQQHKVTIISQNPDKFMKMLDIGRIFTFITT
jgi:hypothetical protein